MNITREPVLIISSIQAALIALVGVLVAFEVWEPTSAQIGALTALYVAVASVAMVILRGMVYAPDTIDTAPFITQDIADSLDLVTTAPGYQEREAALNGLAAKVAEQLEA